jgi:hypothetical protein
MSPKERATGIEPVSLTWKAKALPLSNARSNIQHYTISGGLYNNIRTRCTLQRCREELLWYNTELGNQNPIHTRWDWKGRAGFAGPCPG